MDERERKQKTEEKIDQALKEKFGDEFTNLQRDESLQSAGLDSVDILDAMAIIEKVFGVYFERDELMDISTLNDLYKVVDGKLASDNDEGSDS